MEINEQWFSEISRNVGQKSFYIEYMISGQCNIDEDINFEDS